MNKYMKIRDSQKQKVYDWENEHVSPLDENWVPFEQAQSIVDYIWKNEGLKFPPKVRPLPSQARKEGCANRLYLQLPPKTKTWIIIHELCHSLTSTFDGTSNLHGALFMGLYIQLLSRYLNADYTFLRTTSENAGLKVQPNAKPVFT